MQNGRIVSQITNSLPSESINVLYAQVIPWYLRIYYHTLLIECRDLSQPNSAVVTLFPCKRFNRSSNATVNATFIFLVFSHISPGKSRQRASHLEVALQLPRNSRCRLEIDFERTLLRWTEYPPDAHHGFNLPAASLSFVSPNPLNQSLWLGPYGTLEEKLL